MRGGHRVRTAVAALWILAIAAPLGGCGEAVETSQQPNILLIVVDDLGYTDLGAFGGEIRTPHLDALAYAGKRLTNFHAGPSCAPTRAMLMTGTDNHLAGMGSQSGLETPRQQESRLYQNKLLHDVPTLPEALNRLGYQSVAAAKWHLGDDDALPSNRGFKRSYVLMPGGAGHFDDTPLFESYGVADWREDGKPATLPAEFYSTDLLTDKLLEYIDEVSDDQPFFAYLGYTAPHWPLQAPPASIARYEDQYRNGWEMLHAARMEGARREGVIDAAAQGVRYEQGVVPWLDLNVEAQARATRAMQVYAAMIDRVDEAVGRVLTHLENIDRRRNTVIFFMSDNGAEAHQMDQYRSNPTWIPANFDTSLEAMGSADSYVVLGPSWARATAAPFRESKGRLSEGGIRVPAFVNMGGINAGIDDAYMRVMDLAPTLIELAGGDVSASMMGRSLLSRWRGGPEPYDAEEVIAAETYGRRMARRGDWKILWQEPPLGNGDWQLYNLARDVGEQEDLSDEFPALRAELIAAWEAYADEVGVVLPETPIRY